MRRLFFLIVSAIFLFTSCDSDKDDAVVDYSNEIVGKWWYKSSVSTGAGDIRISPIEIFKYLEGYIAEHDLLLQSKYYIEFNSDKSGVISTKDGTISFKYRLDQKNLFLEFDNRTRTIEIENLTQDYFSGFENQFDYFKEVIESKYPNTEYSLTKAWSSYKFFKKEPSDTK